MKTRIIFLISVVLIAAMLVGGMYLNKKAIGDAYNYSITLIQNGSYEGALGELEKANQDILDRDEFKSDMKYGGISGTYKNTIPLYAYSLAQLEYNSEDKYMHTVNDYLNLIPASYGGELCEEIKTFKEQFKLQYDEYVAEEKRKAEEERLKRIQEEEQRIRNSVPYVGMSESRINDTILGSNYESFHNYDMKGGKRIEATVYRFKKGNVIIFVARCIGGRVDSVSDYRDDPWVVRSYTSSSSKKKTYNDNPYNVNDYSDPEDFYDDNYDDFWDYEDAEDYYNEYHDLTGECIMKLSHQKLKMMYLAKILMEQTDEEHTITVPEMIAELSKLGISAERKSIYDDLEYLQLFGLDICSNKTRTTNYYVASRDFELPELKLLVDSVQASKFITRKKSMELISKIEKLTSHENAKKLQRQVFITNRVKTVNEQIYYNVDKIHEAIAANKQITFKYFNLDVNKKKMYRKDGGLYTESPVSLTWDDENYYLITYKEKYDSYTHYRVDKMEAIELAEEDRVLSDKPFDLSNYSKTMFQMFSGKETDVSIEFDNELVGVVFDRFGTDIPIVKKDEKHFICHVKVAVSPHFLSWIMSFGKQAKIISPDYVVEEMYQLARDITEIYEKYHRKI